MSITPARSPRSTASFVPTWDNVKRLTRMADTAGFEALVPVARWRGFGGVTNFNGACFETFTWAAGVGGVTDRAAVFATSHVPTIHPIVAAKQATTIDHITGGRFALNIVCGWFVPELEMFGAPIMEHDERYAYATEWLEVHEAAVDGRGGVRLRRPLFPHQARLPSAEADPAPVSRHHECRRFRHRAPFRGQALRHDLHPYQRPGHRGGAQGHRRSARRWRARNMAATSRCGPTAIASLATPTRKR